jgi:lysophospholipase L1-like esterase
MGMYWNNLPNKIYNAGVAGATTIGITNSLYLIDTYSPDIIIIFTGINDQRFFSPYEFQEKLTYIINFLREKNIKIVLMDITATSDAYLDNRNVMKDFPEYLEVNYNPEDFIDVVHLSHTGYEHISNILKGVF